MGIMAQWIELKTQLTQHILNVTHTYTHKYDLLTKVPTGWMNLHFNQILYKSLNNGL